MAGRAPFPNRDSDFDVYFINVAPYLNSNAGRLLIAPGSLSKLNNFFTQWENIFPKSQDSNVRTTSISKEKDDLRKDTEKLLRDIFNDIPRSVLSENDFSTLNIKKRGSHTGKVGKPVSSPTGNVDITIHLLHTLRITDPLSPHTKAKPKGVKFIEIWLSVVQPPQGQFGWKPDVSAFTHRLTTGRFRSHIEFALSDVGKTAFYFARWVNPRGEAGPASEIFSALIG